MAAPVHLPEPEAAPAPPEAGPPRPPAAATTLAEPPPAVVPRRRRRRRTLLSAIAAVVVLGGAGTIAGVAASSRSTPTSSPAVAAAAPDRAAATTAAWLRANLPSTATITTTDPAVVDALTARHVAVTLLASNAAAVPNSFVVTTPGADTSVTAVSGQSTYVPVARFPAAAGPLEVGQIVDAPAAQVVQDRAGSEATVRAASTGLLANPAVTVTPDTRQLFAEGRLDLRAATFLAVLADSGRVTVVAAPTDPAEQSAGLPVRRLVVAVSDVSSLRATVDGIRDSYAPAMAAPDASAGYPAGSALLTWPVQADPTPQS